MSSEDNVVTAGCEEKKIIPLIIIAGDQLKSARHAHTHTQSRLLLLQSDQRDYKAMDWILTYR